LTDIAQKLLADLRAILGKEHASAEIEERILSSYDGTRRSALPDIVAFPQTAEEISAVLKLANREKTPVYPRGAASGLTGGAVPVAGGIVLDFRRMNRILEVDEDNHVATVEPGVTVSDFQADVQRRGLFYPPDPASADFSTLGGNVAECAGGLRAVKYGVTRDYVTGLEVVLPLGDIIHVGARTLKCVTGYDLTRLFVGSEGTLGVFTRIHLRLIPAPAARRTLLALFESPEAAATASTRVLKAGILPAALEFIDDATIECIRKQQPLDIPAAARGALIIELDGDESSCVSGIGIIEGVLAKNGALETRRADNPADRTRLWAFRKAASPALFAAFPNKLNEDICVLPSRTSEMLRRTREIAAKHNVLIANYGHIGEGNLHVNVMYPHGEKAHEAAEAASAEVMKAALELGGTLSGEHGIGLTKLKFLPMEIAPVELALMRSIKRLLDPNNILNPGKIFAE
jgi:glycolate oxidase